jgi:hypothetical protein
LAYAGIVYVRQADSRELTFGVSGLLYKSNLLMYDRQTESLWLQVKREAVTGPLTGTRLKKLPSTITTWKKWRKRYPATKVLSLDTGYVRDYENDPYADYYKSRTGLFSFLKPGPGASEKALIVGVEIGGVTSAYLMDRLREAGEINDTVGGLAISINFDPETDAVTVIGKKGEVYDYMLTYWMVWKGIYPETKMHGETP